MDIVDDGSIAFFGVIKKYFGIVGAVLQKNLFYTQFHSIGHDSVLYNVI